MVDKYQQGWKENQLRKRKFIVDSVIYALKKGMVEIEKELKSEKANCIGFLILFPFAAYLLCMLTYLYS